jgi:hypothetical protein
MTALSMTTDTLAVLEIALVTEIQNAVQKMMTTHNVIA